MAWLVSHKHVVTLLNGADVPGPADEPPVQRTWSAEEFNAFVNEHGRPARDDDRCVLAVGPDGVWQVATDDEIAAWLDKHRRQQQ